MERGLVPQYHRTHRRQSWLKLMQRCFSKHKPHACQNWPGPSNPSERRTKHVFRVNLAQICSAVSPRYFTHKQKVTDSAKNRTLCSSLHTVISRRKHSEYWRHSVSAWRPIYQPQSTAQWQGRWWQNQRRERSSQSDRTASPAPAVSINQPQRHNTLTGTQLPSASSVYQPATVTQYTHWHSV